MRTFLLLILSIFVLAGDPGAAQAQRRSHLRTDLTQIPKEVVQALNSPHRSLLFYKKPMGPHPEIFKKNSANSYARVSLHGLSLRSDATPEEIRCWNVFKSGGLDCSSVSVKSLDANVDLLSKARQISRENGLLVAREYLEQAMVLQDDSRGEFEESVIYATHEKDWVSDNSVLNMSVEEKSKIGIYVIFGIDLTGDSPNRELIRRANAELLNMGFSSRLVNTEPAVNYEKNAAIIGKEFEDSVDQFDQVIFVAASKGVSDLLTYMLGEGSTFSLEQRQKVRGVVSLSGVVRGSSVAEAISESNTALLSISRKFIASRSVRPIEGIRALALDPWAGKSPRLLKANYPNIRWISVSMLPADADAFVPSGALGMELQESVFLNGKHFSPSDGLVETAATILPPLTGVKEWIVRGYGPHALALGTFLNGDAIAPKNRTVDGVDPEAGAEVLSSFMRAMGKEFISGQ